MPAIQDNDIVFLYRGGYCYRAVARDIGCAGALIQSLAQIEDGAPGAQGAQGATGAQGAQGVQGTQGVQGNQGIQGIQGEVGPEGPPGAGGNPIDAWPIGSVFIAVVATSPATLLGGGTWQAIGAGRVLVGLDSGDTDFDTVEETGGAKTVTLTAAQSGLPQHTHTQNAHSHVITSQTATTGSATSYEHGTLDTSSAETEATETTATTVATNQDAGPTGASSAHSNVQPYFVVYMWKRTA